MSTQRLSRRRNSIRRVSGRVLLPSKLPLDLVPPSLWYVGFVLASLPVVDCQLSYLAQCHYNGGISIVLLASQVLSKSKIPSHIYSTLIFLVSCPTPFRFVARGLEFFGNDFVFRGQEFI